MYKVFFAAAAAAALVGAGCGTVVRGTTEKVTVESNPPGAQVVSNMGMSCPAAPCIWDVPRKQEFVATFSLDGHYPVQIPVTTRLSGGGAAGLAGNILIGGVIGVGVDAATGAPLDHTPNPVIANMVPIESRPAAKPRRGRGTRGES
ncbi:translation initiation factor 2 [Chelatococcus reniformis]|uniref:Translation initiation factor 2 n=1 Tax=Chelatococcus reniformis TaxID=1494448 RepID=A0A916XE69_9HYPH|nr:translation initiation factor 2 [Chelatococcus reniformis]GGC63931.1 hypothetical protein GCM10010994_23150 [Chelatococcus reniformis]